MTEEKSEVEISESFASLVKRLGNPESTTMLYAPRDVFQIPQVDGGIGYHRIGACAVVIGDPICLPQDIPELTQAFHAYCQTSHLKTLYLLAHHDFARWALDNGCRTLFQVGAELSIDPTRFHQDHNVRRKVHYATAHGVQVKEYTQSDPSLEQGIKDAIQTWVDGRRGPQIHLGTPDFNHNADNRIFYAQQNQHIVGVLMLTRIDRFQGWAQSYNLAILDAPIGTTEDLLCSALQSLANEDCHFVCLGAVAGKELGEIVGISSFSKLVARLTFKIANRVFKLDAKATYLSKYHPDCKPVFLLCRDKLTMTQLLALRQVLNVKL